MIKRQWDVVEKVRWLFGLKGGWKVIVKVVLKATMYCGEAMLG